jgi:predicted enzyme related to lactoylglutathione lyase
VGETIEKPQGNAQVGLSVENLEETVKELKEKGVKVLMDGEDFGGCKMAVILDPTGNKICLHTRKDGTFG